MKKLDYEERYEKAKKQLASRNKFFKKKALKYQAAVTRCVQLGNDNIDCTKQCSRLEETISRLEEAKKSLLHQVESRDAEIAQYEQHLQTQKDESAEANRIASKWIANKKVFKSLLQDKLDELSDF